MKWMSIIKKVEYSYSKNVQYIRKNGIFDLGQSYLT